MEENKDWFKDLFINEAKPAIERHSGGGTVEVIPEGYIKPEGTKNITENGTTDVTEVASVNVNVPVPEGYVKPEGTKNITENGTSDVKNYENVNVQVPEPPHYDGSVTVSPYDGGES